MDEVLTAAQIEAQFESEWVLIEDPQTDAALEVQRGKVRWHSKDRDEVYRKGGGVAPITLCDPLHRKDPEGLRGRAVNLPFDPQQGLIIVRTELWGPQGSAVRCSSSAVSRLTSHGRSRSGKPQNNRMQLTRGKCRGARLRAASSSGGASQLIRELCRHCALTGMYIHVYIRLCGSLGTPRRATPTSGIGVSTSPLRR